ncbi:MAG TPA: DUF2905 domain-containing protein [Candidatus Avalokitesvara rifleensis]|uniref:DUF2905 domain-containing protein n=1 Tax=Candidatus Avalokitesvara rifleensis TaxID=3367620 RepID=UPI0027135513|nr:DUF2905 domain-containing protein [Candidatus Brocadiales bacterium]
MELDNSAKLFIFIGLFFMLLGLSLFIGEKIPFLGRLPGDVVLEKKDFKLYFPLATCALLSIILSLFFWLFGGFLER